MASIKCEPSFDRRNRSNNLTTIYRTPGEIRLKPLVELILASGSATRTLLLNNVGIKHKVIPAGINENVIKNKCKKTGNNARLTAVKLAEAKALKISSNCRSSLVLGADQMLECDGTWLSKSCNLSEAREVLKFLRGKTHTLSSAIAVAEDNQVIWTHVDEAKITMRNFSDEFIEFYLENEGMSLLSSVGVYKLERWGVQLFAGTTGDYFTILGMPIFPLLEFLRIKKVLME